MSRKSTSEADLIRMTTEVIHNYNNRHLEATIAPMAQDFIWIGSNDYQWCESLEEFCRLTKNVYAEPPMLVSDEEYRLLFRDRNTWGVYGRFTASAVLEDGGVLRAHVRGTYIWRRIDGEIKLFHVHASNAQDIPLNRIASPADPLTENSGFYDYLKRMDALRAGAEKITFHCREGKYLFLYPDEIIFLKAAGHCTILYTRSETFSVTGLLSAQTALLPALFQRIHKSYIVNTWYIDSICRYRAILKNGQEIPIGKDSYMALKQFLRQSL